MVLYSKFHFSCGIFFGFWGEFGLGGGGGGFQITPPPSRWISASLTFTRSRSTVTATNDIFEKLQQQPPRQPIIKGAQKAPGRARPSPSRPARPASHDGPLPSPWKLNERYRSPITAPRGRGHASSPIQPAGPAPHTPDPLHPPAQSAGYAHATPPTPHSPHPVPHASYTVAAPMDAAPAAAGGGAGPGPGPRRASTGSRVSPVVYPAAAAAPLPQVNCAVPVDGPMEEAQEGGTPNATVDLSGCSAIECDAADDRPYLEVEESFAHLQVTVPALCLRVTDRAGADGRCVSVNRTFRLTAVGWPTAAVAWPPVKAK